MKYFGAAVIFGTFLLVAFALFYDGLESGRQECQMLMELNK